MDAEISPTDRTFGPDAVAKAIGATRPLLHSWLARRLFAVESRGSGRTRKFGYFLTMRIAAVAQLSRHMRMPVGTAAAYIEAVADRFDAAMKNDFGRGKVLLISSADAQVVPASFVSRALEHLERDSLMTILDLNRLAVNTYSALLAASESVGPTGDKRSRPIRQVVHESTIPATSELHAVATKQNAKKKKKKKKESV
jgi:hypothetical protein